MIEVIGLSKIYGRQKAVDNISFKIQKGDIVGFIGPNGSGKSTTMKAICGVLSPSSGEVRINNQSIKEHPELVKKIGYLPENNPLYTEMYVLEYLSHVAKLYKVSNHKERLDLIVSKTGLESEKHKKIAFLSKGYKQRVGIAQALIHDPDFLILDEPTTGLDPNQIIEIRNLIIEFAKEKAVLLSTHILQEIEAICNKTVIINKGKIISQSDSKLSEANQARDVQTLRLELKEPIPNPVLEKIEAFAIVKAISSTELLLESSVEGDLREKIMDIALQERIMILEIQTIRKNLEESFKELTRN